MATAAIGPRVYTPPIGDEVFELAEAAKFLRVSETALARSDVPRAKFGTRVLFLRSQLLASVAVRLSHFIELPRQ